LENFGMSHASALLCSCNIQEREHRWGDHQDMRVQVGRLMIETRLVSLSRSPTSTQKVLSSVGETRRFSCS
jgi:hypothetical protein